MAASAKPAPFLSRATPGAVGVDPAGITALLDALAGVDLHSLMIARDGQVIAERFWAPYRPESAALVYSLSKTFTATAVGLLCDEGRIALTDRVVDHLPVDPAGVDPAWHAVLVEHCLSMTVGHTSEGWDPSWGDSAHYSTDDSADGGLLAAVLTRPPDGTPGTMMAYNQIATYLLSNAVTAVTGERVSEFLGPRLFEPLGTSSWRWQTDGRDPARANDLGFTGLRVDTGTLLSLAQVYLDGGRWRGAQLLSADWVNRAVGPYLAVSTAPGTADVVGDWQRGYGFSFWQCRYGYRGDGAFGQYLLVLPDHRMTLALTSETTDMQAVLTAVWDHLLPAVDRPDSGVELDDRPGQVDHPTDSGAPAPLGRLHRIAPASGEIGCAAELPDRIGGGELRSDVDGWQLSLDDPADPAGSQVKVGATDWRDSVLVTGGRRISVAARGGVQADGSWRAALVLIGTPHRISVVVTGDRGLILRWREVPLNCDDPVLSADLD